MKTSIMVICLVISSFVVFGQALEGPGVEGGHLVTSRDPVPSSAPTAPESSQQEKSISAVEARGRARLLHETISGTLQVMHRDFFRKDETRNIPSRSLEDVFSELEDEHQIRLRWIAVDTKAMSVEHEPKTEIEREAAEHLKKRVGDFEQVSDSHLFFASHIRLSAVCLSCHLPSRSNNDDRFAGLLISMPIRESERMDGR